MEKLYFYFLLLAAPLYCYKAVIMRDFCLDKNNDIKIENGDFVIAEATLQHQNDILQYQKGEYKEHPEVGVGLANALLDENPRKVISQIRQQFKYDGLTINEFNIAANGNLIIDAEY